MLGYPEFHNDLIKKYVTVFGSLFNDIEVERTGTGNTPQHVKVPLSFSTRDKVLAFADKNFASDDTAVAIISPRMGFDLTGYAFDASRMTNKHNLVCMGDGTTMRAPVPWNLYFELYILGKNAQETNRIVEQIIPFFTPSLTVVMKPITGNTTHTRNVPITILGMEKSDTYQGAAEDRRNVMWTIQFSVGAWFYGPVASNGALIKQVIVNFAEQNSSLTVQPGLTAGGQPTTDIGLSIPYTNINASDDYGFIVTYADG